MKTNYRFEKMLDGQLVYRRMDETRLASLNPATRPVADVKDLDQ